VALLAVEVEVCERRPSDQQQQQHHDDNSHDGAGVRTALIYRL